MKDNNCPECGEKPEWGCRCPRHDSGCKNGHRWHTCTIHHVKVRGESDHSTDTFTCTCGSGKVYAEQLDLNV